jgi:hypothetical protein
MITHYFFKKTIGQFFKSQQCLIFMNGWSTMYCRDIVFSVGGGSLECRRGKKCDTFVTAPHSSSYMVHHVNI